MKKRLVLTGASGKLGSTLINFLNKEYNLFPIGNKNKPKNGYKLDLTNFNKLRLLVGTFLSNHKELSPNLLAGN